MKAQRRHELRENDLAHALEVARKYLDENGKKIGFALVVAIAVIAVTGLIARSQTAATEDRWRSLSELSFQNPEVGRDSLATLHALIRDTTDERFMMSGLIRQGHESLRLALDVQVPPDRELNDSAREAFTQLRDRFSDSPLASGLARLGLATVEENSFVLDGESSHKEAARMHLDAVAGDARMDSLPFKRMAMDRLAVIDEIFTPAVFDDPLPEEDTPNADAADPVGNAGP